MPESYQHILDRVRSPRVHITYDVETGGAIAKRELPLVVGIMAGLSGDTSDLPPLKERKFVEIDRDNFDLVLEKSKPTLGSYSVGDDKRKLDPPLKFTALESFTPFEIVKQVAKLKQLHDSRRLLADLAAKLDGNDDLQSDVQKELPRVAQIPATPKAGA